MDDDAPNDPLGPAAELGAIDNQRVRVWVRSPGAEVVTGALELEGEAVTASTLVSEDTDWTGALEFTLPAPAPGAAFTCTTLDRRLTGHLAPSPGDRAGLAFGFGSCNLLFDEHGDPAGRAGLLLDRMRESLERAGCERLLLLGDQIYTDAIPGLDVFDPSDDPDAPPPHAELLARYRRIYRAFFAEPAYRRLRERFSTLCTWDDHEVFDNWGALRDRTPLERRLFEAACRTYGEYQHARNPGGAIGPPPYHYSLGHGDVGFLALDTRGARDPARGTMLGDAQWGAVEAFLAGEAERYDTLFVLASVPIAHVSRWFTEILDHLPERRASSVRDRWCSTTFIDSRDALLDGLFAWQRARPRRQVFILSGDVHAASAFTIRERSGGGVLHQVTSSAMTTPLVPFQMVMNRIVVRAPNLFERRYRFTRHFVSLDHNIGVGRVEPLPEGGHRVRLDILGFDAGTGALVPSGQLVAAPEP